MSKRNSKKKKMNRKSLIVTFSIIFICILSMTLVYAALSTTLDITGNAEVNSAEWGLKIEKALLSELDPEGYESECSKEGIYCGDNYALYGDAKLLSEPVIDGTSIKDFSASFTKPGDIVLLNYTVTNNGSIPAKFVSRNYNTPQFLSVVNNSDDILWAQNNFSYGDDIGLTGVGDMQIGEVICPGETRDLFIVVMISSGAESLPSGKINISNLGSNYLFSQANDNECPI